MPRSWEALNDPCADDIGTLLLKIAAIRFMNAEKWKLLADAKALMKSQGYVEFESYSGSMHLSRIGDSCIFDVSERDKSKLKAFRGRMVRVVCVGSGRHFNRTFMAKPVDKL